MIDTSSFAAYTLESPSPLRPRERVRQVGLAAATDQELLQIMLGSGTRQYPVEHVATLVRQRLDAIPNLGDLEAFSDIPGLGPCKQLLLGAAWELFRRQFLADRPRIRNPADAVPHLQRWTDRDQEHFLCLSLNGAHELVGCRLVTIGLLNRTLVPFTTGNTIYWLRFSCVTGQLSHLPKEEFRTKP